MGPGLRQLWTEAARGRSIRRMLLNQAMARWRDQMHGTVVDLACGRNPGYWRALGLRSNPDVRLVGFDINPAFRPTVLADLTRPIPLRDACADVVISVGFLGMTPHPLDFLREIRRVLRPGGFMIASAPLVTPHSDDAHYFRFTGSALRYLCAAAGFTRVELVPLGGRWTGAAGLLAPFWRPRWLVAPIVYWTSLQIDALALRRSRGVPTPAMHLLRGWADDGRE